MFSRGKTKHQIRWSHLPDFTIDINAIARGRRVLPRSLTQEYRRADASNRQSATDRSLLQLTPNLEFTDIRPEMPKRATRSRMIKRSTPVGRGVLSRYRGYRYESIINSIEKQRERHLNYCSVFRWVNE